MLQLGVSLTDDTRSVNYNGNTFIIQATGVNFQSVIVKSVILSSFKNELSVIVIFVVRLSVVKPNVAAPFYDSKQGHHIKYSLPSLNGKR